MEIIFKKTAIISILILISHYFLMSQDYVDYYNRINEAERLIDLKKWEDAYSELKSAFSKNKPIPRDYYMLSKCSCMLGKKNKARKILYKASAQSYSSPVSLLNRDSFFFQKCFNEKEISRIISRTKIINDSFRNRWASSKEIISIEDTVKYFFAEDQRFRSLMKDNPCKYAQDTSEYCNKLRAEWVSHDSILQERVYQYIKENGFPWEGGEDIYILLSHFHSEMFNKMKPILLEELKKGKVDPFFLGMVFDRMEIQYKSNPCGYYVYGQDCPSDNWEQVIKNRLSIGMSIYYNGPRRGGYGPKNILPWASQYQK